MPENFTTASGTIQYFKKHQLNPSKVRKFGDLALSALAVGTYLGECTPEVDRMYEEALVTAVKQGINFFDTAVNYRCQRSEKNIAYAIKKLASEGITRDQIFVSTKGGFLPAEDHPESYRMYVLKSFINSGIITPEDIVNNCHCMTPDYLQSQILLSLKNLRLDCIDLYYLHNPENQLPVVGEVEFYNRLTKAFELFEKNVTEGKIKSYGLATWNGFRQGFGAEDRLDLQKILKCAHDVAGDNHHFKAIQLPYNLAMLEAVAIQNQKIGSEDLPIVTAAARQGIGVFISAPLMQSHTLKLPEELYKEMPGEGQAVHKVLQFVLSSPGVISAMVGMKHVQHVEQNVEVLAMENWKVEDLQNIVKLLVRS